MKLTKYLDLQVKPKKVKTISLGAKYPESSIVFEYADGESARIDGFEGPSYTKKGEQSLLQNLTGATEPTAEDGSIKSFNKNLMPQEDLEVLQKANQNIVRAWVLEW